MKCHCPIWVDGTLNGRILHSLTTANLEIAATKALELEADTKPEQEASVDHAVETFLQANKELKSIHTYNQVLVPFK
jgi:hypothetical protein